MPIFLNAFRVSVWVCVSVSVSTVSVTDAVTSD